MPIDPSAVGVPGIVPRGTKKHPDLARETLIDAFIDAGPESTPEQLSKLTSYSEEQVVEIISHPGFERQVARRLVQRGFSPERSDERFNEIQELVTRELYRRLADPITRRRIDHETLLQIMKNVEKARESRYKTAALQRMMGPGEKRLLNEHEALRRMRESTAGQMYLRKKGLALIEGGKSEGNADIG